MSGYELEGAIRSMANLRAVWPDGLPAELLKVFVNEIESDTLGFFHKIVVAVLRGGDVP